jgi:hypothetical protein
VCVFDWVFQSNVAYSRQQSDDEIHLRRVRANKPAFYQAFD